MHTFRFVLAAVLALSIMALAIAADAPADKAPADAGKKSPDAAKDTAQPAPEKVLDDLLTKPAVNPIIEPTRPDAAKPAQTTATDPATIGTAPDAGKQTQLRREGQFLITRRCRMVRAISGASPWMLTFDADSSGMADPPMYILPCQMLEDMEQVVAQQGESVVFVVSGQIFVYHGANYLLPTLMKLSPSHGNLQP
ncbi:MAG: hypothetical protein GC162_16145 [Planctomycetes bacterium]|nr:hypothetical protein [Planctomycetota bacterium]